jgi:hypothetical protein
MEIELPADLTATGKPTLEGWAIIDNTTGEDWNKVQLSLVSGRPISFISQLVSAEVCAAAGSGIARRSGGGAGAACGWVC